MDYTLAAMKLIRKSRKFDIVNATQIDALADYLEQKDKANLIKTLTWNDIINVVKGAK